MTMDKEQKNIVQYYGAFAAAVLSNFIPLAIVQLFGLCLLIAILIGAYVYKARSKLDSLAYNHMTYLIGTIWISSLFLAIGLIAATYWVYAQGDHTLIEQVVAGMNNGVMYGPAELQNVLSGYIKQNLQLLVTATLCTVGPCIVYVVYRTAHGLSRASKGYRIAKPAAWF